MDNCYHEIKICTINHCQKYIDTQKKTRNFHQKINPSIINKWGIFITNLQFFSNLMDQSIINNNLPAYKKHINSHIMYGHSHIFTFVLIVPAENFHSRTLFQRKIMNIFMLNSVTFQFSTNSLHFHKNSTHLVGKFFLMIQFYSRIM